MKEIKFPRVTEQVAATLRQGIEAGRWRGALPGRYRLAEELGVNHKTVLAAVRRLVDEGVLQAQGVNQRHRIVPPPVQVARGRELRVRILLYDRQDRLMIDKPYLLDQLHQAGFNANFAVKSLTDLGMDVARIARFVHKTSADAWIVCAGSREVLEWFSAQPTPAIAMFGRFIGLPIAASSPRIAPAMITAVRRLFALGHRRMVMITNQKRRTPYPALLEQMFLDELQSLGLPTGSYNLPDWEDHPEGLRQCLDNLFRYTPPTALLFGETPFFVAGQQHLARRGILAPEHVSLVCSDPIPAFDWCEPAIAHFQWDYKPVVKRVLRWVQATARGKPDQKQALFDGSFIEGGTIGPPPQ